VGAFFEKGRFCEILKFEVLKCHFLHSLHLNFALKFMLNVLVFEIKEGKNAQRIKKLLTTIYHYLVSDRKT
jgi:hypothetical protein